MKLQYSNPAEIDNQLTPNININDVPIVIAIIVVNNFLFNPFSERYPTIYAAGINPRIYPPVGPNKYNGPKEPPAKTGNPTNSFQYIENYGKCC